MRLHLEKYGKRLYVSTVRIQKGLYETALFPFGEIASILNKTVVDVDWGNMLDMRQTTSFWKAWQMHRAFCKLYL